jgi:hypothetical protein
MDPLYYDWAWDPLKMPAVALMDPCHVDFMLNNLRKFVTKVNEQSQNPSYIAQLLISNIFSQFQNFDSVSIIFKVCAKKKY